MGAAVVIGGGPTGLTAGMIMARHGIDVTVLEKDTSPVPESASAAWESWERHGVAQFRQAHTLLARGRQELESSLPEVTRALKDLGAHEWSGIEALPSTIEDRAPRSGDSRFISSGARRPIYELAFARAASEERNLEVRRGVTAEGLLTGPSVIQGVPHVTGVQASDGQAIRADIVIDAGGRRSRLGSFLEAAGAGPIEEKKEDSRFAYYTRFYRRSPNRDLPRPFVARLIPQGSISILVAPGDNDTWSVTLYGTTADRAMRAAKDPSIFERVLRAHPAAMGYGDGEPTTGILVMAGVTDRRRTLLVDGRPIATGVVPLGDAWACTNPSLGRGLSMTLMHVNATVPDMVEHLDDPLQVFEGWDDATETHLRPWHDATLVTDRTRNREMDALRLGQDFRREPADEAFNAAVMTDADSFRAALEMTYCLATPEDVMSRPEVQKSLRTAAGIDIPQSLAPTRAELEELLAG